MMHAKDAQAFQTGRTIGRGRYPVDPWPTCSAGNAFLSAAGEFDCSCRKRMRPGCPARSSR